MKLKLILGSFALAFVLAGAALWLHAQPADPAAAPVPGRDAEPPPRTAGSRVTHVTVYPNSALVTREVEVPAGQGTLELVVTPMPERTVQSSLYSEGENGLRVMSTRFRTRAIKEDTREEVRKLEDEIKKLQREQQKLQGDAATCQQNMQLLGKLENFTQSSTTHATEKGKLDSDATIQLVKYVMDGRAEKHKE